MTDWQKGKSMKRKTAPCFSSHVFWIEKKFIFVLKNKMREKREEKNSNKFRSIGRAGAFFKGSEKRKWSRKMLKFLIMLKLTLIRQLFSEP